jgi:hypothetical protein
MTHSIDTPARDVRLAGVRHDGRNRFAEGMGRHSGRTARKSVKNRRSGGDPQFEAVEAPTALYLCVELWIQDYGRT